MKKSVKKTVKYLSRYIGKEIIRIKPCAYEDWSYMGDPVILEGFTPDGRMLIRRKRNYASIFGNKVHSLDLDFTDRFWITYKKACRAKHNELNKYAGQRIRRICPTSQFGDKSFMAPDCVTLISASKHHVIISSGSSNDTLNYIWAKPDEWELVD